MKAKILWLRVNSLRVCALLISYPNLLLTALATSALVWNQYSLLTPIRYVLNPQFHLTTPLQSGLLYIAPGGGYLLGTMGGRCADYMVRKWINKRSGVRVPEGRLKSCLPFMIMIIPACVLIYGWTVEKRLGGIAVPIVVMILQGVAQLLSLPSLNTYCLDVMQPKGRSAEAVAGNYCYTDPALGTEHVWHFNSTLDSDLWDMQAGKPTYTKDGADFSIASKGYSILLVSNFYIFFGVMEAHVKMAKGAGIISSVILQSDDLDEIDWEWVGYNTSSVQSDFFCKGNTATSDRGAFHAVDNADTEYHNYTSYWAQDRLEWWIDGSLVRTVNFSDPLAAYGKNYPQSPCQVKSQTPFTMSVQKIRVQDFQAGKEYTYSDQTGSYESIKVISPNTNSTAVKNINKSPPQSLSDKWNHLSKGTHIGIFIAAAASIVISLSAVGSGVPGSDGRVVYNEPLRILTGLKSSKQWKIIRNGVKQRGDRRATVE
ncbi:putative extracellular glycosidase [Aspergillus affinis]|uniref:putative extracellular glycosidase n=1 Tax=Aspergillus affinis TaxID=1070780 RepID=UPI0022FE4A8D|nr:putative extracellular glycosidase [Aspergillus affinis]KAI9045436.1 putative extracellular glycosidase [Aspergillus affinis]